MSGRCRCSQPAVRANGPGKALELAHSTTGKKCDNSGAGIKPQPHAGRIPVRPHWNFVGEWMPHQPHRYGTRLVDWRLERKQREHHVDGTRNLVQSVTPPRPDRRTDEVNRLHPGAPQCKLEGQIEIRRIHPDECIGRIFGESPGQSPPDRDQFQIAADHLEQPP